MRPSSGLKLHDLSKLVVIQAGDVYRFSDYHFKKTAETRDKYFIVLQIDEVDDSFYGFFTTTVSKYYSHITEEGCFNTPPDFPCYFLKSAKDQFHKHSYVQFNNVPDISFTTLKASIQSGQCKRFFIMPKETLYYLTKCAFNCKSIERIYKKGLKDLKDQLALEVFKTPPP